MLLQTIFVVTGLVLFIDVLFEKWDVWGHLDWLASKTSTEFIYTMLTCRFCVLFHVGWILTIIYGLFAGFSGALLIVPFVVGGFIHLINKQ